MREADTMTVLAHIAEWFNTGNQILRNKYDWRITKYKFSTARGKVAWNLVIMYRIPVVSVKSYVTGSIDVFLLLIVSNL
jgi:hypothetical protein